MQYQRSHTVTVSPIFRPPDPGITPRSTSKMAFLSAAWLLRPLAGSRPGSEFPHTRQEYTAVTAIIPRKSEKCTPQFLNKLQSFPLFPLTARVFLIELVSCFAGACCHCCQNANSRAHLTFCPIGCRIRRVLPAEVQRSCESPRAHARRGFFWASGQPRGATRNRHLLFKEDQLHARTQCF
jgi:hypothetical protein